MLPRDEEKYQVGNLTWDNNPSMRANGPLRAK